MNNPQMTPERRVLKENWDIIPGDVHNVIMGLVRLLYWRDKYFGCRLFEKYIEVYYTTKDNHTSYKYHIQEEEQKSLQGKYDDYLHGAWMEVNSTFTQNILIANLYKLYELGLCKEIRPDGSGTPYKPLTAQLIRVCKQCNKTFKETIDQFNPSSSGSSRCCICIRTRGGFPGLPYGGLLPGY